MSNFPHERYTVTVRFCAAGHKRLLFNLYCPLTTDVLYRRNQQYKYTFGMVPSLYESLFAEVKGPLQEADRLIGPPLRA